MTKPDTTTDEINDHIAEILREQAEREADEREPDTPKDNSTVVRALGMLAEARRWFKHKGWETLPISRRGWLIVQWGAEVAWHGNPGNPDRGARAWCCKWQPLLKLKQNKTKLDHIIAEALRTKTLWAPDVGGAILEITVSDLATLGFRFLGAYDDQNYDIRREIRKEKNAECQRRRRAKNRTGAGRGRPPLQLPEDTRKMHDKAQAARRAREYRARKKADAVPACVTEKCVTRVKDIGAVTELNVTRPVSQMPCAMIRANAIDLDTIDLAKFGVIAVRVMRGTDVLREWKRGA